MLPILVTASVLFFQRPAAPVQAFVDPAAARALDAMVKAYRSAGKLYQDSSYTVAEGKLPPLIKSRLIVARPNRIVLDMTTPALDRPQPYRLLYQSDGKELYAYQEMRGFYVKEKAPKDLKELDYLAVSIEMAAITGGDPVTPLIAQAKAVRMGEAQLVDSVQSDVVVFEVNSPGHTVELKLAIGQKDHLLRRFEYSSVPLPPVEPDKAEKPKNTIIVGDPDAPPPPEERPEAPIRLTYENHVYSDRDTPKDVFKWVPPVGSFAYQDYPGLLNPKAGSAAVLGANGGVMATGQKPMKIIPFSELMKKAWAKNKK